MYRANRMLSENNGQPAITGSLQTRHRCPPSVLGSYHSTATSMGQIMEKNAHAAVQGALVAARNEMPAARPRKLNLEVINDTMGVLAGREICETFHGNSAMARPLASIASKVGPPTSFTNLPQNNALFDSRSIPSSRANHRQVNNRLAPMPSSDAPTRRQLSQME